MYLRLWKRNESWKCGTIKIFEALSPIAESNQNGGLFFNLLSFIVFSGMLNVIKMLRK